MILTGHLKAASKSNPTQPAPQVMGFGDQLAAEDGSGIAHGDDVVRPSLGRFLHARDHFLRRHVRAGFELAVSFAPSRDLYAFHRRRSPRCSSIAPPVCGCSKHHIKSSVFYRCGFNLPGERPASVGRCVDRSTRPQWISNAHRHTLSLCYRSNFLIDPLSTPRNPGRFCPFWPSPSHWHKTPPRLHFRPPTASFGPISNLPAPRECRSSSTPGCSNRRRPRRRSSSYTEVDSWAETKKDVPGNLIDPLVDVGFSIFSVDYRLAPKHPFPAATHDVETAIAFVKQHAPEFRGRSAATGPDRDVGGGAAGLVCRCKAPARKSSRRRRAYVWRARPDAPRFGKSMLHGRTGLASAAGGLYLDGPGCPVGFRGSQDAGRRRTASRGSPSPTSAKICRRISSSTAPQFRSSLRAIGEHVRGNESRRGGLHAHWNCRRRARQLAETSPVDSSRKSTPSAGSKAKTAPLP